jgi:lipid-binding SYLF domain-containing protein
MKLRCFLACVALVFVSLPVLAGDKEKDEETFKNGAKVLQEMLDSKAVPQTVLAKANCVIVLPSVKKFGFGIGGSGGRGPMSCRTGKKFSGKWSAPAMLRISGVSAGLQVGGSSTDYILLVMSENGANAILKGKTKLGNDATAAAGPSGATTSSAISADVLTYGRAKGLFAGVSLSGATLESDDEANKRLYGKTLTAQDIVLGSAAQTQAGGQPLVALLDTKAPKRND